MEIMHRLEKTENNEPDNFDSPKVKIKWNERGLRQFLIDNGASASQLNAAVVSMIEDAMFDETVTSSATAREMVKKLQTDVRNAEFDAKRAKREVDELRKTIDSYEETIHLAEKAIEGGVIEDRSIVDGVVAFTEMLKAVKNVFGQEAMSDEVICKAIEAGSYGMWRSVMGPKFDSKEKRS